MPWPAIRKTENNDGISRLNSRPKLPFPGNGKGNYKMPREGKGNLRLVFPGITGNGNSRSPLTRIDQMQNHLSSGCSMHYVSTIFTTIGYGATTPATLGEIQSWNKLKLKYHIWKRLTINILGGKLMTILMIVTLIPFFLHCLCTSASNINTIIDRFSPSTSQQDRLLVNLSELWASQTTMVTLKIWQQKNMTSMQSCARKPFGK